MVVDTVDEITEQAAVDPAAFKEGYEGTPTEMPATPETPASPGTDAPETPPVEPAIKYAQLTEDQLADLLKMKSLQGKLDEGFGTLGHVQQMVKSLQSASASGPPIEVTDEDMAELKAEFPEFAELTKKALTKVLGRLKGPASAVDVDAILAQAETRAVQARQVEAHDELIEEHPTYREIVGHYETRLTAPTAFQSWAAKQSPEFQTKLWNSNSAAYLSKQLTRFQAETAPAPTANKPPTNERTARLAASVTPKGVAPAGTPPEENGFNAGFKAEAQRLGIA